MKPRTKRPDHCVNCTAYHVGAERWCCFYGQRIEAALSQCLTQDGKQRRLDRHNAFWNGVGETVNDQGR